MLATIGYEKASLDDFVATLKVAGVDLLVDIRDRAQSRRKGFSKTALSEALNEAGLDYLHLRELGDPKEGREAARAGDFKKFRQIFDAVIQKEDAVDALQKITELMSSKSVCLMCYERDYKTCHRKIVADKLVDVSGQKVRHLGVRHGQARSTTEGRVLYPGQGAAA